MPERSGQGDGRPRAHPRWFRAPSLREHLLGTALFAMFAAFFVLLFLVERGWAFRWVLLGSGVVSFFRAARHLRAGGARRQRNE